MAYPNYRNIRNLPLYMRNRATSKRRSGASARGNRKVSQRKLRRLTGKKALRKAKSILKKALPASAFASRAWREGQAALARVRLHRTHGKPIASAYARLAIEPEIVLEDHDLRGTQKLRTHRRVRDMIFSADAREAALSQGIRLAGKQAEKWPLYQDFRRMVRHPQHLSKRAYSKWAGREWKEFSGLHPSFVAEFSGTGLTGEFPGVRLESLEGTLADSRRRVVIDATRKPLYLVWSNGGRRFALAGSKAAIAELARDFSQISEPIRLRVVNYMAPRYPVPVKTRRTYANTRRGEVGEMGIAFTHRVEREVYLQWNGETSPEKALFWLEIKGKSQRFVNRSGIIF